MLLARKVGVRVCINLSSIRTPKPLCTAFKTGGVNAGLGYIVMAAQPEDNQQLLALPDQSPWRAGFGEGGRLEPLCTSLVEAEKEGEEGPASLVLCPPVSQ